MSHRLVILLLLAVAWGAGICARLVQVQVTLHEFYREQAEAQQIRKVEIRLPRGTIFDARGRELAVSLPADSLAVHPHAFRKEAAHAAAAARFLADILDLDAREIAAKLESEKPFVWIKRQLTPDEAEAVRALDIPGLKFEEESRRYYPMGELAGAVLGFTGVDGDGLEGLEKEYDATISSQAGRRTRVVHPAGGLLSGPHLPSSEAEAGADLYLTLDATLQHVAEHHLAEAVREHGAARGTAVFLDPRSGAVLAMASYPEFDPNRFREFSQERWRSPLIHGIYEPGSTFKVVTAAAALTAGAMDPEDPIDCLMGQITVGRSRIRDHQAFGILTFSEVIAKSSNVGIIKVGQRAGPKRLEEAIAAFGFGKRTGIDLPGEGVGRLKPRSTWHVATPAYYSFGQGLSVTPLQLANAFAAVANGGNLLKPYLVAEIGRGPRRVRMRPRPTLLERSIDKGTARELRRMLEATVSEGSGQTAAIEGYRVAGKTGTAQKIVDGRYSDRHHVASFVGFVPARDPALVGLVVIDEPWPAYHGGQVAGPVFAKIAKRALLYLGVPPDLPAEATSARSERGTLLATMRDQAGSPTGSRPAGGGAGRR